MPNISNRYAASIDGSVEEWKIDNYETDPTSPQYNTWVEGPNRPKKKKDADDVPYISYLEWEKSGLQFLLQ